jgi:ribose transport system substrate-binding protein
MPEFDAVLQPVGQGVQQTSTGTHVKIATAGGDLPALQEIKAGRLALDVGEDFPYEGWGDADEAMRMMLGMPVVAEHVPVRLFTAGNVGSLHLTPAAQASGEWYGSSAYMTMFEHLWGLR